MSANPVTTTPTQPNEIRLNPRTDWLLSVPLSVQGIAHFGGKGSSKTVDAILLSLAWCERWGSAARCLILRSTQGEMENIVSTYKMFLRKLYFTDTGNPDKDRLAADNKVRASYNGTDKMFHDLPFEGSGLIQLGYLDKADDIGRYSGGNFNFLFVDEFPKVKSPSLVNRVRAELRGPQGMKPRVILTGNPGMRWHDYCYKKFIKDRTPYQPWIEDDTGMKWITIPSNASENHFLDATEHMANIAKTAEDDPDLALALQTGDFTAIKAGEFFGNAWSQSSSVIWPWEHIPTDGWRVFLSIDHGGGSSATVAFLCALAMETTAGPDGSIYPRGSLVLFDEFADVEDGEWDKTLGYSIRENCSRVKKLCAHYDMRPQGIVDPQVDQDHGGDDVLHDLYTAEGVHLRGWKKHRRSHGAAVLRQLMHGAAPPKERSRPGLYVTSNCRGFLATVPFMPRHPSRRDEPEDGGPDHWYDAAVGAAHHHRESFSISELNR